MKKNKKNKRISIQIFVLLLFVIGCVICDFKINDIENQQEIVNTLAQIQISIVALTITMSSITTTFIKDEIFGVELKKIFKLRRGTILSLKCTICILLIFSSFSIYSVINNALYLVVLMLIMSIYICLHVSFQDLPLCFLNDNAIIDILKNNKSNMDEKYLDNQENYNKLLVNYAIEKRINKVYKSLRDGPDVKFIDYLFEQLCSQLNSFPDYEDYENKNKVDKYVSSLLDNIELLFNKDSVIFEDYKNPNKMASYFSRFFYGIHKKMNLLSKNTLNKYERIFNLLFLLLIVDEDKKNKFIQDVVFKTYHNLLSWSLTNSELWVVELLRKNYSKWSYTFTTSKMSNILFSEISMVLFYYYNYERSISESFKLEIKEIIDENKINNSIDIVSSWKTLFNKHLNDYKLTFVDLIDYFDIDKFEFMIMNQTKTCIFSEFNVADWWVKCLISSDNLYNNSLIFLDEDFRHKNILANCIDKIFEANTKNVIFDNSFKDFANFYDIQDGDLNMLGFYDEIKEKLFNFKNAFKKEEMKKEIEVTNVSNHLWELKESILNGIYDHFNSLVKNDKNLDLSVIKSRGLNTISELFDLTNTKKLVLDYIWEAYKNDFRKEFDKKFVKNYIKFEDKTIKSKLEKLLNKNPSITTGHVMYLINKYSTIDEELKIKLVDLDRKINCKYGYPLVSKYTYFTDKAISFNYEIDTFDLTPLSEEEVLKELEKYKSDSGTYFYQGVQFSYLELIELIKNKYFKMKIYIKYLIKYDKKEIFVFKPFEKK